MEKTLSKDIHYLFVSVATWLPFVYKNHMQVDKKNSETKTANQFVV